MQVGLVCSGKVIFAGTKPCASVHKARVSRKALNVVAAAADSYAESTLDPVEK